MLRHVFKNKNIIVGVSGGIAAYKAAELVRLLVKQEACVRVIMTAGARNFVGELTFQALSGNPVGTSVFDLAEEARIGHIALAESADAIVVAPATANIIAKLAVGIADDLLTTVIAATRAPVCVAPAMNVHMLEDRRVEANVARLRELGFRVVEPAEGDLACGYEGKGRLPEAAELLEEVAGTLQPDDLASRRILVTAGPTWEALDPVRYIANRSSGKMGFAVARAARRRGAEVDLVSGPTTLPVPRGVNLTRVLSAEEMRRAVLAFAPRADAIIMAAAVGDFRVAKPRGSKIRRLGSGLSLRLEPNPDILGELGGAHRSSVLVGFAAETGSVDERAKEKLERKGVDMIVANDVSQPGAGFDSDTNIVTIIERGAKPRRLPKKDKDEIADILLDRLVRLLDVREARGSGRRSG